MELVVQNKNNDVKVVRLEEDSGDVNVYVGDELVVFFTVEDDKVRVKTVCVSNENFQTEYPEDEYSHPSVKHY